MPAFSFTVALVNEDEKQPESPTFDDVLSLVLSSDGRLDVTREGSLTSSFAPTSWGSFKVVRVASSADRV
jgi:hypothetical protein